MVLEGPCFDRAGDLLFSDVYEGRVLRLTPDKHLSTVFSKEGLGPGGLAIHKDRRIFIAGIHDLRSSGSIVAVNPDGSGMQTIVPLSAGYQRMIWCLIGVVGFTSRISVVASTTCRPTSRPSPLCFHTYRKRMVSR